MDAMNDSVDVFFLFFLFLGRPWEVWSLTRSVGFPLEFGIWDFLYDILLFFCQFSQRHDLRISEQDWCRSLRSFFFMWLLYFLSFFSFLLSCSDLFAGRRQTGLAVQYYLDRT
jgi:hypothetical protein